MTIRFGTDGWRAIIAEDFTFDNVRLCAQGTANYLKRAGLAPRGLVVGYDTRFASDRFAATVAGVVAANGVPVFLCSRPAPTPVVSYNLVTLDAGGGVVITASHNSAEWNGYKFKGESGGSAPQETVDELERLIAEAAEDPAAIKELSLPEAEGRGILQYVDPEPTYLGTRRVTRGPAKHQGRRPHRSGRLHVRRGRGILRQAACGRLDAGHRDQR